MRGQGSKSKRGHDARFIGKSLLSCPASCAGLVALSQTFVRRYHGGLGSSGPAGTRQIRIWRQGSPPWSREVLGGQQKQSAAVYPGLAHRSLANRRLSRPSLCRSCCFAPNICSSLPWWFGFTQACREPANQGMTAGSRVRSACKDGGVLLLLPLPWWLGFTRASRER